MKLRTVIVKMPSPHIEEVPGAEVILRELFDGIANKVAAGHRAENIIVNEEDCVELFSFADRDLIKRGHAESVEILWQENKAFCEAFYSAVDEAEWTMEVEGELTRILYSELVIYEDQDEALRVVSVGETPPNISLFRPNF